VTVSAFFGFRIVTEDSLTIPLARKLFVAVERQLINPALAQATKICGIFSREFYRDFLRAAAQQENEQQHRHWNTDQPEQQIASGASLRNFFFQ
jgi:hypothetical protein